MLNLIPPKAYRDITREYWIRVISVWVYLVATAFVILAVLTIPVYVLVYIQSDSYNNSVATAQTSLDKINVFEAEIKKANNQASIILNSKPPVLSSEYVDSIIKYAGDTVAVSTFRFDNNPNTPNLVISGEAATRNSLADFKTKLENDGSYLKVDLPISSLIKDVEVPFTMNLAIATSTKKP